MKKLVPVLSECRGPIMKYHKKHTRIFARVEYLFVDPNETLIGTILADLGVRFRPAVIKHQATVLMSVREGSGVPVFSPHARTHKFELAKKLVDAQRFRGAWPKWLRHEVDDLLDQH